MEKNKKSRISGILSGILIGVLISTLFFVVYSKFKTVDDAVSFVSGGWVIAGEYDGSDPDRPHSLNFSGDTVTVVTAGGQRFECPYAMVESCGGLEYVLKIYDYPGIGDIEFTYTGLQPILRLKGSETILDGEYLFAG